jgi:GntR family transcriptional regulator
MTPLKIKLDFRSSDPIYIQISSQIKHQIAVGTLQPGNQLPTVRQLAADLRVNFNTVARAYRMLDDEGIISTQHGRGTFILDLPEETTPEKLRQEDLERLTRYYLHNVSQLNFSPEEIRQQILSAIQSWEQQGELPEI